MFIETLRLIRIFLKTEIFFAVFISLPSVPTAHSKTQLFETVPRVDFFKIAGLSFCVDFEYDVVIYHKS